MGTVGCTDQMAQFVQQDQADRLFAMVLSLPCDPNGKFDLGGPLERGRLAPGGPGVGGHVEGANIQCNDPGVMFREISQYLAEACRAEVRDEEYSHRVVLKVPADRGGELGNHRVNITGEGSPVSRRLRNPHTAPGIVVESKVIQQEVRRGKDTVCEILLSQVLPSGNAACFVLGELRAWVFGFLARGT